MEDLTRFIRHRARQCYTGEGRAGPSLSVVGYSPDDRGRAVIETLAGLFPDGTARVIGVFDAATTH